MGDRYNEVISVRVSRTQSESDVFAPLARYQCPVLSQWQTLEISAGDLRHLSGLDPSNVFRPRLLDRRRRRLQFWLNEFLTGLALSPVLVGFVYLFIVRPLFGDSTAIAAFCLLAMPFLVAIARWLWRQHNSPKTLAALLEDVDRFHDTLKAIDIGDRLSDRPPQATPERDALFQALSLIREDLIRALKTERILRENQDFLATSPEQFASNLATIRAIETHHQAGEYAQFLNEALQIGMGVREELNKLQRRS